MKLEDYQPKNHDINCTYHVDQYPWECDCGRLMKKENDVAKSKNQFKSVETLLKKAAEADNGGDAKDYAQAALSAAQALTAIHYAKQTGDD